MADLPRFAISVRQPWAWAITCAGKDIENRSWRSPNPGLNFRGPVCIHAAKGMTKGEYEDASDFMAHIAVGCVLPDALLRGGIIGVAEVVDIVRESSSPWWMGPRGLVLANVRPIPFIPVGGQLGFFEWKRLEGGPDAPARWMTRYGDPAEIAYEERTGELF